MDSQIKTTGQLRQFLCDSIVAVKNGDMKPDVAARVVKLASQVTENYYAEVKVRRTLREAGETFTKMGELPIR